MFFIPFDQLLLCFFRQVMKPDSIILCFLLLTHSRRSLYRSQQSKDSFKNITDSFFLLVRWKILSLSWYKILEKVIYWTLLNDAVSTLFFCKRRKDSQMILGDVLTANEGDVIMILRTFHVTEAVLGFWLIFSF